MIDFILAGIFAFLIFFVISFATLSAITGLFRLADVVCHGLFSGNVSGTHP